MRYYKEYADMQQSKAARPISQFTNVADVHADFWSCIWHHADVYLYMYLVGGARSTLSRAFINIFYDIVIAICFSQSLVESNSCFTDILM